jgi:hypothetical protein
MVLFTLDKPLFGKPPPPFFAEIRSSEATRLCAIRLSTFSLKAVSLAVALLLSVLSVVVMFICKLSNFALKPR